MVNNPLHNNIQMKVLCLIILLQGLRHDFGIGVGGGELKVGRKMCVRLRARKFLTTSTST